MLLIDDEADNASINTAYKRGAITKINSQIRKILNLFPKQVMLVILPHLLQTFL